MNFIVNNMQQATIRAQNTTHKHKHNSFENKTRLTDKAAAQRANEIVKVDGGFVEKG